MRFEIKTKSTDACAARRIGVMDGHHHGGIFLWVGGSIGHGDNEDDDQVAIITVAEAQALVAALDKAIAKQLRWEKKWLALTKRRAAPKEDSNG